MISKRRLKDSKIWIEENRHLEERKTKCRILKELLRKRKAKGKK